MSDVSESPSQLVEMEETAGKGLSKLIQKYVGKPLDKSNQMSDWGRRPLRQDQIVYAGKLFGLLLSSVHSHVLCVTPALDAYCLLDAYEVMKERALQLATVLHIDVDVEPEMPLMKWIQPRR